MSRRAIAVTLLALTTWTVGSIPTASAGGGGCAELTEGSGSTVEILYSCITPTILRIEPGRTVTFVNRDSYRHVLTGAGYGWYDEDGWFRPGEAIEVTFERNGVYPYQCYLHPGMTGAVVVGDGSGPGAATRSGVTVEPLRPERPSPEVVLVTPEPRVRTVVTTVERTPALPLVATGAVGVLVGAAGARIARGRGRRLEVAAR